MKKLFGTDGIRAVAGQAPLDTRTVYAVGLALANHLSSVSGSVTKVLLGMDTRESSDWIARTLTAGLNAGGASVETAGIITTPGVAFLTAQNRFAAGVVISASHNPWQDNGIKLFGPDGYKLPDSIELAIEAEIFRQLETSAVPFPETTPSENVILSETQSAQSKDLLPDVDREAVISSGAAKSKDLLLDVEREGVISTGAAQFHRAAKRRDPLISSFSEPTEPAIPVNEAHRLAYIRFLLASVPALRLDGLKIVLDCANGAASAIAPELFALLIEKGGGEVVVTHASPSGRNINENCGALHPSVVAEQVLALHAELGITFDGDADRALFADANGKIVNGDAVLLLAARDLAERSLLANNTVVATTMSNMGLEAALKRSAITMLRAPVGDKYVLEQMLATGATLGGEQSGHIIFSGRSTTGDGILTALLLLDIVHRSGKSLAELTADLKTFPQVIVNVKVREKRPLETIPTVARAIADAEAALADTGRVVIRYSGTEALARVMIEAESEALMRQHADAIADAIRAELGV